jgi:hypothetical protein
MKTLNVILFIMMMFVFISCNKENIDYPKIYTTSIEGYFYVSISDCNSNQLEIPPEGTKIFLKVYNDTTNNPLKYKLYHTTLEYNGRYVIKNIELNSTVVDGVIYGDSFLYPRIDSNCIVHHNTFFYTDSIPVKLFSTTITFQDLNYKY